MTLYLSLLQTNSRRKFNLKSPVVLKACSDVDMVAHAWKATSSAAMLVGDIAPPNSGGFLSIVTVRMLAALPASSRPSDPYKFTVAAKFSGTTAQNTASATLRINYVRVFLIIIGSGGLLHVATILCTKVMMRYVIDC